MSIKVWLISATLMNHALVSSKVSSVPRVCVLGFLHVCVNVLFCRSVGYDLMHQNSTADVREVWILSFQLCY